MTQTTHMLVRDALIAVLLSAPALAGSRVVGNRRRPMAAQDPSQIYVYLESSAAELFVIGTMRWSTRIRVECAARATAGASAEDAADALGQAAYARIMADPSLGGAVIDTEPIALAWSEDEADTTLAVHQQIWSLTHTTTVTGI